MLYIDTRHAVKPVTIATNTLYKWLDKQYRKGLDIQVVKWYIYVWLAMQSVKTNQPISPAEEILGSNNLADAIVSSSLTLSLSVKMHICLSN